MADVTKLGDKTVIAAADIADVSHPINTVASSQANGQAGIGKVPGRIYLRDNGSNDYDIAIPSGNQPTDPWHIIGTGGAVVTPS